MKTLLDLKKSIDDLLEKDPENGKLPIICAKDDEGNGYHTINYDPCLRKVRDLDEYYLEVVSDDEEDFEELKYNAIIIN